MAVTEDPYLQRLSDALDDARGEFFYAEHPDPCDFTGVAPLPPSPKPLTESMTEADLHVRIRTASVDEVRQHGERLFRANVEETEPTMALDLSPDWATYRAAEKRGQLIVLAAWFLERLVGYAVAGLSPAPHYRQVTICQQDLLYVDPQWRTQRVGLRLIEQMRREATRRGAHQLFMHAKPGSRLEALLPRIGFEVEEIMFKETLCPQE